MTLSAIYFGHDGSTDPIRLAADFPPATSEEWRELVGAVLRKSGSGADVDPEAKLTRTSYDGIKIKPLYTAADAVTAAPVVRGTARAGWDVRALLNDPDPRRANTSALRDLANGATSLWLRGVAADDLDVALDGVYLDLAPIVLDLDGGQIERAARRLIELAADPAQLAGSLGLDPIGGWARTGYPARTAEVGRLAELVAASPQLRLASIDATVYHDAGASDAVEVAIATAVGVAYLRELTGAGLTVEDALNRLEFRFAVTDDQFASIAKLRAARQVWGRVAELSGAVAVQHQHAVTSAAMMTIRDPWVNMLRTTIGCFAAAVGGADAITVLPFDSAIGVPDEFARRIARNTSAVLHDESSLSRVLDAGGGSWYIEALTDELAEAAWTAFTQIEGGGGALSSLQSGTIASLVAATRDARARAIATRRAPITGVSEFALISEPVLAREPVPAPPTGPLPLSHWADGFETLRDRADAFAVRPKLFLAALGPVAAHTARLAFASNLFQAGGIEPVVGTGDADQLATAFKASGTAIACLCGSDVTYDEQAAVVAQALGAEQLWLAGRAEVDGVDGHIYVGCDALEVLTKVLDAS